MPPTTTTTASGWSGRPSGYRGDTETKARFLPNRHCDLSQVVEWFFLYNCPLLEPATHDPLTTMLLLWLFSGLPGCLWKLYYIVPTTTAQQPRINDQALDASTTTCGTEEWETREKRLMNEIFVEFNRCVSFIVAGTCFLSLTSSGLVTVAAGDLYLATTTTTG